MTEGRGGVARAPKYHCCPWAVGGSGQFADLGLGLIEPHWFNASDLYKYYCRSTCHSTERAGSSGTFRPCHLVLKAFHKWPSVCFCQSQPFCTQPCFSLWDSCAPRGTHQGHGHGEAVNRNHWPSMAHNPMILLRLIQTVYSFSQSFNRYFTEHLQFARHCSGHWESSRSNGNRQNPYLQEVPTHM